MTMQHLIKIQTILGKSPTQIAGDLGITPAMVSTYKRHNYMPSLPTARIIYRVYNEVVFPYCLEAVSSEGYGHEFDKDL